MIKPAVTQASADGTTRLSVQRHRNGLVEGSYDLVAEEVPVALEYNGISHAVMMASPRDLEDFACGYTLTEGIVDTIRDVSDVEVTETAEGVVISMRVAGGCFARLKHVRRIMAGRTGCGLCGIESLQQLRRNLAPVSSVQPIKVGTLQAGMDKLPGFQPMHLATGATHAAAWLAADGEIRCAREDVGRHNALDKLIGAMAREGQDFANGAVLLTSRASYEMVQKSAFAGIGIVAAVSAPTALAVRLARELNVTLIGFARAGSQVVYANEHRLVQG